MVASYPLPHSSFGLVLSQISTVESVDNTERRSLFIAADGHAETQRISEFSHDWCMLSANCYGRSMC